jgi:amino acid transporter
MEKKKVMLIIGGAAVLVVGYFGIKYLSKPKTVTAISSVTPTIATVTPALADASAANSGMITPSTALQPPPPGYSGPFGGPYQWGGVGDPPNGVYTITY